MDPPRSTLERSRTSNCHYCDLSDGRFHARQGTDEAENWTGTVSAMIPLRIGNFTPAAPVVLAPMAGVTNAAFRTMCRSYGPDLVYVNEMVMATAVVHR